MNNFVPYLWLVSLTHMPILVTKYWIKLSHKCHVSKEVPKDQLYFSMQNLKGTGHTQKEPTF